MRKIMLALLMALPLSALEAEGIVLEAGGIAPVVDEQDEAVEVLFESNGYVGRSLTQLEAARYASLRPDGQGTAVENVVLRQFVYSSVAGGNVIAVFYDEPGGNPAGVAVSVDGTVIGNVPNGFGAGFALQGVNAGPITVALESLDDGTMAEASMLVLGAQPFADVSNLSCEEGDNCSINVSWTNDGPAPDQYVVRLDGGILGLIPGTSTSVTINGVLGGAHEVRLFGLLRNDDGWYEGELEPATVCFLRCVSALPVSDGLGLAALALVALGLGLGLLRRI